MRRLLRALLLMLTALAAGLAASELVYRSSACRRLLAEWSGLEKEVSPWRENLRAASSSEPASAQTIDREIELLRDQFGDETIFLQALTATGLSLGQLRERVAEHERALAWIERQIGPEPGFSDADETAYFETHREQFSEPARFRASHLFLAAPDGSPSDLILAKQSAIEGLAVRLLAGEAFAKIAAEASEDEQTKSRGGDLGWFAVARMPPEFIAEVAKLEPGQISGPFRSHLGFHTVQLAEVKPARELTFAEARPEIQLSLGNTRRRLAVAQLRDRLARVR